ncbi:MAG: 2Fe-2S iron-sulfur cluster-binding protein [Bdellovibrionales bacterium]
MSFDLEKLTYPLKVNQRVAETAEAVSLVFQVPPENEKIFHFDAGQFLTLFLSIEGEIVPRSYSLCSSPAMDRELKVTIKRVAGGKGSNFILDKVKVGDVIRVAPPAGHFFRPPTGKGPHHWVLCAAGSGITPIYSILKTVLMTEPESQVSLIFANRSPDLVIYARELEAWQNRFPQRLKIQHVFSQPPAGWSGLKGRCEGELLDTLLKNALPTDRKNCEAYLCGPDGFMSNLKAGLLGQGLSEAQVHIESFTTTAAPAADAPSTRVYIGQADAPKLQGPAQVQFTLSGEDIRIQVAPDQSVLEALIENGSNPPYSCLDGNCMACVAKVRRGRVYQNDPGILLDENIAAGETLTCQARPASPDIHIDFDTL